MKAVVLESPRNLVVKDIPLPQIGEDDVLVKVAYVGICGSDMPRSMNDGGARMYPLVLGHEFSGVIDAVGSNVAHLKKGDRVAIAPLIPNEDSIYTQEALYGLSDDYTIIGTGCDGAFAEYVSVPKRHVMKVPDSLDLKEATGVEPAAISYHAMYRSQIEVGDSVAVIGIGPIWQLAVQCARIFGAKTIIAIDIEDSKLDLAMELGADATINSKTENVVERIKELTTYGVNVVIESAGSPITQALAIDIARKRGRIVYVGISHKDLLLKADTAESIMRGELSIIGSWNSYTAPYPGKSWTGVLDGMNKGQIKFKPLITHTISLDQVPEMMHAMANRSVEYNKVLIEVHPEV